MDAYNKQGPQGAIKACLAILKENPKCWNAMDSLVALYNQTEDMPKALVCIPLI